MSDFYIEQLVAKKNGKREMFLKLLIVLIGVLGGGATFIIGIPFGLLILIAAIAVMILIARKVNLEYEYLFVNGDLDIDIIYNKSRRKPVFSMNVKELEIFAPTDSIELKHFQRAKAEDYSSGCKDSKTYGLVIRERGVKKMIIFEPNEKIVEAFWMMSPRKVIRN